jgi:hypothetical protein
LKTRAYWGESKGARTMVSMVGWWMAERWMASTGVRTRAWMDD